jgi:protein-L-isoaspartate O-methyltransferase
MNLSNLKVHEIYTRIRKEFFVRDEFDRLHGTETSLNVNRRRMQLGSSGLSYEPAIPDLFAKACQSLPSDAKTYTFIDLGSGKGRVLIMAHEYGFQNIIGVELSDRLIAVCRQNLAILGITNVSIAAEDASTFSPPNGPLVVCMNNPFTPPLFNKVVERLTEHRLPLYLIYLTPRYRAVIEQTNRFATILEVKTHPGFLVYKMNSL